MDRLDRVAMEEENPTVKFREWDLRKTLRQKCGVHWLALIRRIGVARMSCVEWVKLRWKGGNRVEVVAYRRETQIMKMQRQHRCSGRKWISLRWKGSVSRWVGCSWNRTKLLKDEMATLGWKNSKPRILLSNSLHQVEWIEFSC